MLDVLFWALKVSPVAWRENCLFFFLKKDKFVFSCISHNFLVVKTLTTNSHKMLDPDLDSINPDPQHWPTGTIVAILKENSPFWQACSRNQGDLHGAVIWMIKRTASAANYLITLSFFLNMTGTRIIPVTTYSKHRVAISHAGTSTGTGTTCVFIQ
jgi:hypothetical protein